MSSTSPTLLDVKLFIRRAAVDELTELQESLNARRLVLDGEAQFRFPRNSQVRFDAGRRGVIYGTVTGWRRGGKAEVLSKSGAKWTVGGSHLRPQ